MDPAIGEAGDVDTAVITLKMENGAIAAAGTHDELLSTCSIYREIHDQQTKGGDDRE